MCERERERKREGERVGDMFVLCKINVYTLFMYMYMHMHMHPLYMCMHVCACVRHTPLPNKRVFTWPLCVLPSWWCVTTATSLWEKVYSDRADSS